MLTSPKAMDVAITQRYVCQIHSQHHINVCALENGYLSEIKVREGQAVKKGDLMFKIVPTLTRQSWTPSGRGQARNSSSNAKKLSEKSGLSE